LKRNCWLVLDRQIVKILMKLYPEFIRLDPFVFTKKSSRG
jgi:hypothetical protein